MDDSATALFFLDDAEGMNLDTIAKLTAPLNGSGKKFANNIIESQSRMMIADIESIIPKGYTIKSSLNSFCNTCTYTGVNSSVNKTGVIVKNISPSKNAFLTVDSLKVKIQNSGDFTIVIDDGITPKTIAHTFTAGTEAVFTNIGFKTSATSLKIYFNESGVSIPALNCPTQKSCGCSGGGQTNKDIQIKGLLNDAEFTTQYGFIPCASIVCSMDNIICQIINQQPRLFGLALFYRCVARVWAEVPVTGRNNQTTAFDEDTKLALADRYMSLYYERLRGSSNVKGISDNLAAALNNVHDHTCIECKRLVTTSWATG